jgi:RNA polymerase sigma-70 factor (ECF subfamily)
MYQPEDIIQRIAAGDRGAFRQLYDMYSVRVYNTCLSYLHDVSDAEEITQDVFLEVHQSAARFLSRSSVTTWIYRIAVNKSLDKIRYRKRHKRFAFISSLFSTTTGELVHDPPSFEHPGVVAENKERAAKLFGALKQLPENQQTAFILKQIEGLPQKEIAIIMDLGEKAVESLIQRAKANLRKLLQGYFDESEGK